MYASILPVRVAHRESNVMRSYEQNCILSANRDAILTLELSGFLFFGSSVQILNFIQEKVLVAGRALLSLSSPIFFKTDSCTCSTTYTTQHRLAVWSTDRIGSLTTPGPGVLSTDATDLQPDDTRR